MSAKKKRAQPSWVQCEKCEAIVLEKDVVLHGKNCPPSFGDSHVPYVLQLSLNCEANSFSKTDESLKFVADEDLDDFVLLSQAALQLCNIPIGDHVLVSVNHDKFVKRAWKGNDRPQLSAAFWENGVLFKLALATGKHVKISHLQQNIATCREIILKCEGGLLNHKTLARIQRMNAEKVFFVGSQFQVFEYGKTLGCCLEEIVPHLDHLNCSIFYKALRETIWRCNSNDTSSTKNNSCLLEMVGGYKSLIDEVEKALEIIIGKQSLVPAFLSTQGIILHGPNGTGKSLLMKALANKWSTPPHPFRHFHVSSSTGQAEKDLAECFKKAKAAAPSILTIDDLDILCSNASNKYLEKQPSTLLCSIFDRIRVLTDKPILVLAACNDINKIEKSLRRPGRFDKELEVDVPNPQERCSILEVLLRGIPISIDSSEVKAVADIAHGFVGADLAALVSKAASLSLRDCGTKLKQCDLLQSLSLVRPSALREIMIQVPDVKWEDIGGQEKLKHQLRQAVEWPLKYADSFTRLGISPPRGVLMYGPPGCSKTMIAKALATESGLNFISVKGPELFSKWVGESEKAVREVFRKARQSAPCIVFFDELDALAGERAASQAGAQVQERVLAQLLTELDGVEALGHVIVVGATNRPDRIDPALLRPGRLDRVVHVPLPDFQTRSDIFTVQFRKTPVSKNVSIDELASLTDGYSGAEVVAVCHEAALNALDHDMKATVVTRDNFASALQLVTPRTPKSALDICEAYARRVLK